MESRNRNNYPKATLYSKEDTPFDNNTHFDNK